MRCFGKKVLDSIMGCGLVLGDLRGESKDWRLSESGGDSMIGYLNPYLER